MYIITFKRHRLELYFRWHVSPHLLRRPLKCDLVILNSMSFPKRDLFKCGAYPVTTVISRYQKVVIEALICIFFNVGDVFGVYSGPNSVWLNFIGVFDDVVCVCADVGRVFFGDLIVISWLKSYSFITFTSLFKKFSYSGLHFCILSFKFFKLFSNILIWHCFIWQIPSPGKSRNEKRNYTQNCEYFHF